MLKFSTRLVPRLELARIKGLTNTWQFGFAKTVGADQVEITKLPGHIGDTIEGNWALPEHSTGQKFVPIGALAGLMDEYSTAPIFIHDKSYRWGASLNLSIQEFSKSHPGEQLTLISRAVKIGYYVGYVEFSIKSQVDGRLIARGSQNKFLPTGKYPKLWALAAKCTPLVAAVFNRDFAQKRLDPESWSGLLSVDGQRLHFEDLFASNGEGKMVCTPKTQNWNHILQGGAAISSAEQFLMGKEDGSSYTGSDDPQLSYFQISYFQPIGLGEGYNLKLDDSTLDMHKNMASTVSLLNQSGKMACHIHCLRYS